MTSWSLMTPMVVDYDVVVTDDANGGG